MCTSLWSHHKWANHMCYINKQSKPFHNGQCKPNHIQNASSNKFWCCTKQPKLTIFSAELYLSKFLTLIGVNIDFPSKFQCILHIFFLRTLNSKLWKAENTNKHIRRKGRRKKNQSNKQKQNKMHHFQCHLLCALKTTTVKWKCRTLMHAIIPFQEQVIGKKDSPSHWNPSANFSFLKKNTPQKTDT